MALLKQCPFDNLLFTQGNEGVDYWHSERQVADGKESHIRLDSSVGARTGNSCLRVEIEKAYDRKGVWRSELRTQVFGGYPNVMQGWYSFSFKLGTTTIGEESAVMCQLWDGTSGPSISIQWDYSNNKIFSRIHGGPSNVNRDLIINPTGWVDIDLYHESRTNNTGRLKIWVNGTLTVDYTGRTSYATETDSETPYWKLGLYDSGFGDDKKVSNRVIYYDQVSYHDTTNSEAETLAWISIFRDGGSTPPPVERIITTTSGTGGTVTGGGSYLDGQTVTLQANPDQHFQFTRWTEGGGNLSTSNPLVFTASANRTIAAVFSKVKYNLTVTATAGGTASGGGSFEWDIQTPLTATVNSGYRFLGWYRSGSKLSENNPYNYTTRNRNDTVEARFEPVPQYTVTLDTTAGGTASGGGSVQQGGTATLQATPADHYRFVRWMEGGSNLSTSNPLTITVNSNRTITAVFEKVKYTLTVTSTSGGSATGGGSFEWGIQVPLSATVNNGYEFLGWFRGSTKLSGSLQYQYTTRDRNDTVEAKFELLPEPEPEKFSVALSTTGGGTVSGAGSFNKDSEVTVSATPDPEFEFEEWRENGQFVYGQASYTFTIGSDRVLVAVFKPKPGTEPEEPEVEYLLIHGNFVIQ